VTTQGQNYEQDNEKRCAGYVQRGRNREEGGRGLT
jgi:hypothetical protein